MRTRAFFLLALMAYLLVSPSRCCCLRRLVRPRLGLPRRFHAVARLTMRASTSSTPSNIVQRMEFDDHEDHEKNWNDELERYR